MVNKPTSIMQLTLSMFDRLHISPILLLSHVTRTVSDCRRIQGELQNVSQSVSSLQIIFNCIGNHSLTVISFTIFVLAWDSASRHFMSWTGCDFKSSLEFIVVFDNSINIHAWKPTNSSIVIQFISYVWWLLHVSALYCHPQGAFLEPSERCSIEVQSIKSKIQ
jgi:hypothetical protein